MNDRGSPPTTLKQTLLAKLGFAASAVAWIFWWWSLFPSLLPRSWMVQALVSALAAASGYLLGAILGGLLKLSPGLQAWWKGRVRNTAWRILWIVVAIGIVLGGILWLRWQNEHRVLVELEPLPAWSVLPAALVTLLLFGILLAGGRFIRWLAVRVEYALQRFVPTWVSVTVAIAFVTGLVVTMTTEVGEVLIEWTRESAGVTDRSTDEGVVMPSQPTVSGSPESLVAWDTLGRQGRNFVAGAPTVEDLVAFAGPEAEVMEPIRAYVGRASAPTLEERADLLVEELHRTGAFDREILVAVTVTGTGWVDPDAALAIEYMYGGDTAIAGLQYSYLPSWISFLVDGPVATDAAAAMNIAIAEAYLDLPESDRPKLVLFAESLGSLGFEQAAFQEDLDGTIDLLTDVPHAVLFSGPTYNNPMWRQLDDARGMNSPVWRPVYDNGRSVQTSNMAGDLEPSDPGWEEPRIAYLHHPSDPVGYWNVSLLWTAPDWVRDPIGAGVSPDARWFPITSFWQVVFDLTAGFSTDPGFGHNYADEFVHGWAAVSAPDGWTNDDTDRLSEYLEPIGG